MMDVIQRPVVAPAVEIAVNCAPWRKILWDVTPLATRAEDIHQTVHHFPDVDRAFVAATFGWRNQGLDLGPLLIRQVMGVAHTATVVSETGLICPHWAPRESVLSI